MQNYNLAGMYVNFRRNVGRWLEEKNYLFLLLQKDFAQVFYVSHHQALNFFED